MNFRIVGPFLIVLTIALAQLISAQRGAVNSEWRHYGGDQGGTKYSPLDQINASNVNRLEIVWRWKTASLGGTTENNWQVTPLAIDGTLYFTAGPLRSAVALD